MSIIKHTIAAPTRSTMFLNDISVVDHAYIDDTGCVVGGSFNPCFEVSGTPDPVEKVVVDFSTIKKDIKDLIDKHDFVFNNNGFDHKIWIIEGYSRVTVYNAIGRSDDLHITITTPNATIGLPADAVKNIPEIEGYTPCYSLEYIGAAFEQYLQPRLEALYPNVNIRIRCMNTTNLHVPTDELRLHAKPFRYVHGLKDSTSYGCNNIAHGHGSFITADKNPENILQVIADELDNTVFVRADNQINAQWTDVGACVVSLEYTTPRGTFSMSLNPSTHKVVILNTETTVEYLAQYVKEQFGNEMRKLGITTFYISEGLSKGAVETL